MILVNIDAITQYILSITPAIAALMGVIVVVAVGVGKVKAALNVNSESVERTSKESKGAMAEILRQNAELKKENTEIKKALVELNKKIEIIDVIKAVEK